MKSLLIVVKEEYLSKGIAIALMDYYQSIHTTKNPYDALDILSDERIDTILSELNFNTIKPNEYLKKIFLNADTLKNIILIKDTSFTLDYNIEEPKIQILQQPISIKDIISTIKTTK